MVCHIMKEKIFQERVKEGQKFLYKDRIVTEICGNPASEDSAVCDSCKSGYSIPEDRILETPGNKLLLTVNNQSK